jgi:hypothetical protein
MRPGADVASVTYREELDHPIDGSSDRDDQAIDDAWSCTATVIPAGGPTS